jgi:glycosyltransferase involved in cell wall biosynthesis
MESEKILCVGNWESDVGYAWWLMERFGRAIAERYPGRVTICFKKLTSVPKHLKDTGAQFLEYDFDLNRADIADFVRQHGFRHLYLTDKPYWSLAYAKLRRAGVKTIIMHDHMPGERTEPSGIRRVLKTIAGRIRPCSADAYIAVSELGMRRFARSCCLPAERCHLALNGIDLSLNPAPVDIRAELGIPADSFVVVSSGRVTRYKGVHHVVAASRLADAHFVHCGDGPDLTELRAQAPANMHFLGKRSDVPGILASVDAAVHASSGEGLSLSILEFMRAGLAIILPNSVTVAQSVQGGVSALLYDDPAQLPDLVTKLMREPDLRASLGSAAKEHVKRYNLEHTVDSVLSVFSKLRV